MGYSSKSLLSVGGGVLLGVGAAKYLPSLIPASITSSLPSGGIGAILITGAAAWAAALAAKKFLPPAVAEGVTYGGAAITISAALNAFAPPPLNGLALSGVGDITSGNFVVPQNPLKMAPQMIAAAPSSGGGMGAFRGAFMGRR